MTTRKDRDFFLNDTNLLHINEKGIITIIDVILADESFKDELFSREFVADTIDVFLDNPICRRIMFEAIKGNQEYK